MKKIVFQLLIILFFNCQFCLAQSDFNKLDENGKKNGLWKGFHQDSKRLRFEGTFEHGIEIGVFKFFDDTNDNTIIATRTFSKNGTVAENIFMDQKGNAVSRGKTVNKQNEGVWTYFHFESKDVKMIEIYSKGKLNGVKKVFYKNNIIAEESVYLNDKKNGLSKIFANNGVIMEEAIFKNGEYNGPAVFREPNGKIASKGNFVNGAKKGKWQFFENGKVKKEVMLPEKVSFGKPKDKKPE